MGTEHQPKFAWGEPRNIALIGHWDGWQPFGSPGQHSCGECKAVILKKPYTSFLKLTGLCSIIALCDWLMHTT